MPRSLTLLVVDDEPAHARLLERTLRRAGILNRIVHVGDGARALELLVAEQYNPGSLQQPPVLVVLDLNMPGMDGYQVLERLRSGNRTRHVPVIVLTTTQESEEFVRCQSLGCDAFLSKPVGYLQFLQATKRLGLVLDQANEAVNEDGV